VLGAVKRIAALQPKPVRTYLWTGNCDPPAEALAMCDQIGIANMNGANAGQHKNYESLTNMRSVAQRIGGHLHFNARSQSENNYTALWTRNYYKFRDVIASYELMEKPYRLAPIHLYFHYYLVEQPGGDRALQEIYDWIQAREIYPMTASEYVAWVRGFYAAKVDKVARGTWRVRDYGACRTVRFDDTQRFVDIGRSTNVLGFRRDGNTLYVHLAEGVEAIVALTRSLPKETYLIEANGDWRDGRIVAKAPARATFSTREGPVSVGRGDAHEAEVDIR
jgi:polysaccharide biosynthesis protein PelA